MSKLTRAGLLAEHRRVRLALGTALLAVAACGESSTNAPRGVPDATTSDAPSDSAVTDAGDATDTGDAADAAAEVSCTTNGGTRDAAADAAPDADPGCWYDLPCGISGSGMAVVGCDLYATEPPDASLAERALGCWLVEGQGCEGDAYAPGPHGAVLIECKDCLGGGGRRPRGLRRPPTPQAADALGAYFARMAHDEAASIVAFERMGEELARWDAPATLIRAAARARRDEIRHARVMARLARDYGGSAPAPRVRRPTPRSLEAMARENAVEGCVNETYGALLLAWQARFAPGAALRRTFASIAADEARHAALAWALARWSDARLTPPARARVLGARRRALGRLRSQLGTGDARAFERGVGRPDPAQAVALLDALAARLA